MTNVIQLKAQPKGFEKFIEDKTKFLISQGYSDSQISAVMSELRDYLPNERLEFVLELPGSLGLSTEQSEVIAELVRKLVLDFSQCHARAETKLLHTVLGLLVRGLHN